MKIKERIFYFSLSLFSGVSFFYLSFLIDQDKFRNFDYQILLESQRKIPRIFDVPFSFFTLFGTTEIISIGLILFFLWILVKKRYLFFSLSLYSLIFLVELFGKFFLFHPSPPHNFNRYSLDIYFPSSLLVHTASSFPSGHLARTFFLFVIFLFLFRQQRNFFWKLFFFLFSLLFLFGMFISRIYLGEHWLSDCLGGMVLGISIGTLSLSLW